MIDGGIGGEKSDEGARHIDAWLARNPDARFWAIAYGTNDAAGDASDTSRFRANMATIVDRVRAAGRVPILATIPFASDGQHRNIPRFNGAIEDLRRARSLPPGPDPLRLVRGAPRGAARRRAPERQGHRVDQPPLGPGRGHPVRPVNR